MRDLEVLADGGDVAGQQQSRCVCQALIKLLDGDLLEIRVIQPHLLAIGHQQLLHRRIGVPAELAGTLERQLSGGLLQLGATAVERELREAASQGFGLVEQAGQALVEAAWSAWAGARATIRTDAHSKRINCM